MLVILDRQHFGKPGKTDLGVPADVDGDGKKETAEANLTPTYIAAAQNWLATRGHAVVILDNGWYSDRHVKANGLAKRFSGAVAYVACHLNAGGGSYGLVVHDARSKGGEALAKAVAGAAGPALKPAGVTNMRVERGVAGTWTAHALNTIDGIYAGPANIAGICFEPFFVDKHRTLLTPAGLKQVGEALAAGILAWGEPSGLESVDPGSSLEGLFQEGRAADAVVAHDPRVDPWEGDVVATSASAPIREVLHRDAETVTWRPWPFGGRARTTRLDRWQRACRKAKVVQGTVA